MLLLLSYPLIAEPAKLTYCIVLVILDQLFPFDLFFCLQNDLINVWFNVYPGNCRLPSHVKTSTPRCLIVTELDEASNLLNVQVHCNSCIYVYVYDTLCSSRSSYRGLRPNI